MTGHSLGRRDLEPLHGEAECEEDGGGEADVAATLHHGVQGWGGFIYTNIINRQQNVSTQRKVYKLVQLEGNIYFYFYHVW